MDTNKDGLLGPLFSIQVRRWMSPFLLTCSVYFLLWIPEDQPSWLGALIKCLPVLCLAVFLWAVSPVGSYARLLQVALLCSALGDTFLIWHETFLYGMAAFAVAHLFYLAAFGMSPLQPGLLLAVVPVFVMFSSVLLLHLEEDMVLPVVAYGLILSAMVWRGLARGGSAGWGAVLFALSDGVLAWDNFVQPLSNARLLTMATYYAAQTLIALSALKNAGLKTN
ncbi:lysoplasmalogenase [Ochotona princeps]|uniref:lysoplasmalogenase n=1 Tax=Ochotona princeps TaxID=9978 RepID=UPI002714BDFC|nr:lysoplasmalogenase [Ochotona princeps]